MKTSLFTLALLSLSFVGGASAQSPTPPGLNAKLSFAENKTVYRIGEPIKLVIEFTAAREGYTVETLPDRGEEGADTIVIFPENGIVHWLDELNDNRTYLRDMRSSAKLDGSPVRVEIILNDTLRFDVPGTYTIRVNTRRVTPRLSLARPTRPIVLSTNPLSLEIQSMSEADEVKEVKRLTDLLDAKRDWRNDEEFSKLFSYLTGDPSTREKVRRFLSPEERSGNYNAHIASGLFIARNRDLVLKLIETGMRDPNIPVTSQILNVAVRLKTLLTRGVTPKPVEFANATLVPGESPASSEIQEAYIVELAGSLGKRTGRSHTTTAMTIFTSLPKDSQSSDTGVREARRILLQQFDTLPPYSQELLLQMYWDQLRDPALIPSLKKMLAAAGPGQGVRAEALKRLMEIAPDETRAFVIAEIRDPRSLVDPAILGALKDKSLPEVDASLLEQIRARIHSTNIGERWFANFKVTLLARYATESIYQELMQLYRETGEKLSVESRAGMLAYFAKHNEREALALIDQATSREQQSNQYPQVLKEVTKHYYSDAIGGLLKKQMESDDPMRASQAAYLIGLHGFPEDEKVLEVRLKRWREDWTERVTEADAQQQGHIERELIHALTNGKSWKLPPERVRELRASCITKLCKESNSVKQ
ncbi:MAG TPA: hypothetical protein VJR02_11945 [Pyrinomonadaceae bacterium]|nr:hypothetical protein [Pyrinomonadaceae bacterium]